MNKKELRVYLRSRYAGQAARDAQSSELCRHIIDSDVYRNARVVGGYIPMPREADVIPVLADALAQGKIVAVPLCGKAPSMTLRRITSLQELVPGAYGIMEPGEDSPIVEVHDAGLLLVPLEGVDKDGFRLGKGGGYYDRLLADGEVPAVGCALSWQWVDELPRDCWDKPLSACVDLHGLHWFNR